MRSTAGSLIALVDAGIFASPAGFARYTGPSTTPSYNSVNASLKHPEDDVRVTLEGYIVQKVGKDKYIFLTELANSR